MEKCDLKDAVFACKSDMLLEGWGSGAHLYTLSFAGDKIWPTCLIHRDEDFQAGTLCVAGARCLRVSQMVGYSGHSCRNRVTDKGKQALYFQKQKCKRR